jgi:ubiquinone/menaquinone biosynthesis C-methylase UbiE
MDELRSNREWIFWGEHDPLYAVATRPGKQIGGESPWSTDEFFATGQHYFADVQRQWQQYGRGSEHCVEIGCGAGRITRQLVSHFRRVTAIDVSPAQLESARRLLGADAANVHFALVSAPKLPLPDASCDGVFSCEVFQHLESDRAIEAYIREGFRVLSPSGSICFQVPVRGIQRPSFLSSSPRNLALGLLRRLGRRRMMIYRQVSANLIFRLLGETGYVECELRVFGVAEHRGFHGYFFARKP